MSRELANPIRDLFDAAVRHNTIKVSCQCGNVGIFDPHALWYLFERRGWRDHLPEVRKRMRCLQCFNAKRPRSLATARYEPSQLKWRKLSNGWRANPIAL